MAIDLTPLTTFKQILNITGQVQEQLDSTTRKIASGTKHPDFKGYADDGTVEQLLNLEGSLNDIENYVRSNNTAIARLKSYEQSVDEVQNIADKYAQLIARRRNSATGQDIPFILQSEATLDSISEQLNNKFEGRYIFSGSKTDTPAVSNLRSSNLNSSNEPTTSYYGGDSVVLSIRSSNTQTIEYGILANESAFSKLIGGIHLAQEGHNNNDDELLADAFDMVEDAIGELTSIRANIINSKDQLTDITSAHEDSEILLSDILIEVQDTNFIEATTTLRAGETQLKASFMAVSTILRIKGELVNILG